jgi:DNA-binding transcriptional MerR regulator
MKNRKITTIASQSSLIGSMPDKKYYTIGEVSKYLGIKSHVLRYWEKHFDLDPVRRRNRRYYTQEHLGVILTIKKLMHEDGFTLNGAKRYIHHAGSAPSQKERPVKNMAYLLKDLENIAQDLVFDERQLEEVV